jgi:tRNA(Ile)-lysidine synthetase-like protein
MGRNGYHDLMDAVLAALKEAADSGLMPPGGSHLLAVSGGADSMALLHGAAQSVGATGWRLSVGHVHHGWRGREADRDLAFVRENARRLGLPFFFRRRDARREARALRLSPEAGARHARYAALAEMASEAGAERIVTAHQRDDRLETYLLARERRAGLAGLAGVKRERADGVVRPMLEVSRREILDFLRVRGLGHRRDASNGDLRLSRNRVRRELAGRLASGAEDREESLDEMTRELERLSHERDTLERRFAREIEPRLFRGPGTVLADACCLEDCDRPLLRRAVEEAARPFALPGRPPLTGREREQIVARLLEKSDFRFEAGRRIRFERRGPILRVHALPAGRAGRALAGQ